MCVTRPQYTVCVWHKCSAYQSDSEHCPLAPESRLTSPAAHIKSPAQTQHTHSYAIRTHTHRYFLWTPHPCTHLSKSLSLFLSNAPFPFFSSPSLFLHSPDGWPICSPSLSLALHLHPSLYRSLSRSLPHCSVLHVVDIQVLYTQDPQFPLTLVCSTGVTRSPLAMIACLCASVWLTDSLCLCPCFETISDAGSSSNSCVFLVSVCWCLSTHLLR